MTEQLFLQNFNQMPPAMKQEALQFFEYLAFKYQFQANQKKTLALKPKVQNGKENFMPQRKSPKAGFLKGTFVMSPDFDEPLEDFKEYMA